MQAEVTISTNGDYPTMTVTLKPETPADAAILMLSRYEVPTWDLDDYGKLSATITIRKGE